MKLVHHEASKQWQHLQEHVHACCCRPAHAHKHQQTGNKPTLTKSTTLLQLQPPHLHALALELLGELRNAVLRVGHSQAVAGHDEHAAGAGQRLHHLRHIGLSVRALQRRGTETQQKA